MALPTRVNVTVSADWTGTSATTRATSALSVTAGNALVVAVGGNATGGQGVSGLTDTAGNTYVKIDDVSGPDGYREEIWYAKAITGHASNVVTVTWSATVAYRGIAVVQYAGLDAAIPADGTAKGTAAAGGTTVATGTLTTTRADTVQVIVPRWGYYTLDTITWPSGFSRITTGGDLNVDIAERFVSGTTAATCTITHTYTAIAKQALVAAFTATPAPSPLLASVTAAPPGGNGGATRAIDTTGAGLIVLSAAWYPATTASVTASDSKGNTWVPLTSQSNGSSKQQLFYCLGPTVGTGHTFTIAGTATAPAIFAAAFAGAWTYQTQSGAATTVVSSLASGSVTPAANGALLLTGFANNLLIALSVSPGAWTQQIQGFVNNINMHGALAYQVQATAAAINPTWATISGSNTIMAISTAVFLPATPAAVVTAQPYVWGPL